MNKYFSDNENKERWVEGWFATGDIGELIGPCHIQVIDRKSNIIKLSNGEFIALEILEKFYLQSIYISQIFIYADSFKSNIVAVLIRNKDIICTFLPFPSLSFPPTFLSLPASYQGEGCTSCLPLLLFSFPLYSNLLRSILPTRRAGDQAIQLRNGRGVPRFSIIFTKLLKEKIR